MIRSHFLLLFLLIKNPTFSSSENINTCTKSNEETLVPGDLFINLLVSLCEDDEFNTLFEPATETYVESAAWVVTHLNNLNFTHPFVLGLKSFEICNEYDYQKTIFDTYSLREKSKSLGLISFDEITKRNLEFSRILNVTITRLEKHWIYLVKASVRVIENLDWKEPITVISETERIIKEFNKLARRSWMCVNDAFVWRGDNLPKKDDGLLLVIFGSSRFINTVLNFKKYVYRKILVVPLDGSNLKELPANTIFIQEPHSNQSGQNTTSTLKPPQTPLLLDVANVILNFVQSFLTGNCSISKDDCPKRFQKEFIPPFKIIQTLKLEDARDIFSYDVYQTKWSHSKAGNKTQQTKTISKLFSYNLFENSLVDSEQNASSPTNVSNKHGNICSTTVVDCLQDCVNFRDKIVQKTVLGSPLFGDVILRSDSWLFGFVSIAVLGVIFCISTLIFFAVSMLKRIVFEGNPAITLLLILSIISIYCSIVPFTVVGGNDTEYFICLYRTLSVSLSYAAAFSLLLSRSIVLATISKELGYMSHASGPVQAFLCLFIFAVQCALSLQYFNKCQMFLDTLLFLYSLSYNMILLVLFLCVSPLIYQSQRNYREGKYFAISAVCMTASWIFWILGYVFLGPEWRDPMVCLGLVSTGSILVGAVLIPRTYLMTVSATRNKITNALPTLRTSSSIMDIYKASTQPIYDCVNISSINHPTTTQPKVRKNSIDEKYYKCPSPDNNFEIESTMTDQAEKTTRF